MIDETVRDIVEGELHEGETLLWADRPSANAIYLICLQIFLTLAIPGSLFLLLAFWFSFSPAAPESGKAIFSSILFIIGVVFIGGGVSNVFQTLRHRQNFYAITDEKVISKIALQKGYSRFSVRRGAVTIMERNDKFGTGIFNIATQEKESKQPTMTLIAYIKNPNEVETLLQKFIT